MDEQRKRRFVVVALVALAVLVSATTVFAVLQDVLGTRDSDLVSLLRGSVPALLNAALVWFGFRWSSGDRTADDYVAVVKWMAAGVLVTGGLVFWLDALAALNTQEDLLIVIANTVSVGAMGGLVVGTYEANNRTQLRAVQRERKRNAALFENSPDAVASVQFVDGDVLVGDTNERFEAVFEKGRGDAVGKPIRDVVAPDTAAPVEADTDQWTTEEREVKREAADGTTRELILRLIPVDDDTAVPTEGFAVYTDITEQRRQQAELEATKRELQTAVRKLERSNEELEQFAYVASHDLQEPLRMVSSYVDLLEVEYGSELDEQAEEYIEYAVNGAERMQQMVDDLLTFSRVGEGNLDVEQVDANRVLEDVRRDLRVQIEEHDATLAVEELPTLTADPSQLSRVFQNLVTNAIDYAGDDPPRVHVGVEDEGDDYVFTVADDGVGIEPDQQDRVFDIFTRGERNDDDDGTGIGLTLCKRIVNAHDGEITLESTPGEGTTFYIRIPKVSQE